MRLLTLVGALAVACLTTPNITSAATYTGGVYEQDFDGLPQTVAGGAQTITGRGPHSFSLITGATGLNDWYLANHAGSSTNTEFRAHDGSQAGNMGRGVISFGTTGSSDRALGVLPTSNQISRFGVEFTNNTGTTLNDVVISFTGEQWRRGEAGLNNLISFAYDVTSSPTDTISGPGVFTGVGELSFTNPNTQASPTEVALDGNLPANSVDVFHRIKNVNWGPGQRLLLRWTGTDVSGQDNGMSIDNFSFRAQVPEPASVFFAMFAAAGLALVRKRARS